MSRILKATLATLAMSLLIASSASAAPTVSSFTVSPATANGGATGAGHDFTVHIGLSGTNGSNDNDLDDLTLHLPPGLVANPEAAPKCTVPQLTADNCPAASQVGEVSNTVDAYVAGIPAEQVATGSLYNVVPQPGEPGRFGIVLRPLGGLLGKVILQSGAALRTSDYGLDSILEDLPNTVSGLPIDIKAIDLTLYGKAGASHDQGNFARLPTSCGTNTVGVDIVSKGGATASNSTSFTTENCNLLPFTPELSATVGAPGKTGIAAKPPVSSVIEQTIDEAGLSSARVLLPVGVGADAEYLNLGNYCTQAVYDNDPTDCPAGSVVGIATASSPLLADPLTGTLTLINNPSGLPVLGLDLQGALHLTLFGQLLLVPTDSGFVGGVDFPELPDIPIARFKLDFTAGKLNKLGRDVCTGPPALFDATFNSFSGAQLTAKPAATINGCGDDPPPGGKKPKAKIKNLDASRNPRLKLSVKAGAKKIKSAKLTLPKPLKPASQAELRQHSKAKAGKKTLGANAVSAKGKAITVKLGSASKGKLLLKKGSLEAPKATKAGTKLKFKIAITDKSGKTTKLTKSVKVKG